MGLLDEISQGYNYVNDHLQNITASPLFNLGMGMLNGGTGLNNVGSGIMDAMQRQQQLRSGNFQNQIQQYQLQQMQQQSPIMQRILAAMAGSNPDSGAPPAAPPSAGGLLAAGAQPSGAVTSALPNAPGSGPGAPPTAGTQPGGLLSAAGAPPAAPAAAPAAASATGGGGVGGLLGGMSPAQALRYGTALSASFVPQQQALGKQLVENAKLALANDPAYITQRAAAGDPITQDIYVRDQALARGDQATARAAQVKLFNDAKQISVASNSGTINTVGMSPQEVAALGISTRVPNKGIQIGPNGQASEIPGFGAANADIEGQAEAARSANELVPMYGSNNQIVGYAPKGGSAVRASATGAPPSGGMSFGPNPETDAQQREAGSATGKDIAELNDRANTAVSMNQTLERLRALGQQVQLGPTAGIREWTEKALYPLIQSLGLQGAEKELSAYVEQGKYTGTLGFALARSMGSREAAQIVTQAINMNPNKNQPAGAYYALIDGYKAANNYMIAQNAAVQAASSGGGNARQALATWSSRVDPSVWDLTIPSLAKQIYSTLSPQKVADTLPFMDQADIAKSLRNLGPKAADVLKLVNPTVKGQILQTLSVGAYSGASGTF